MPKRTLYLLRKLVNAISETFSKRNFATVISHETSTSTLISEVIPLRKLCKENERLENGRAKAVDFQSSSSHSLV